MTETKNKINWEKMSLDIIVNAGAAKSAAMEGLYSAKAGNFEDAKSKLKDAAKAIAIASHAHFSVIQEEAKGTQLKFSVLFMHAEDQLLTTQTLILVVEELIDVHKLMQKNNKK